MKIKIICFGKLNKSYFLEAFNNYSKLASKFIDLEVIELKEEYKFEEKKNLIINSNNLTLKLESLIDYEIIILDVHSKEVTSEQFAKIIEINKNLKSGKMAFIIGPSDGYTKEFKNKFLQRISFGMITLPHQLFRIILIEQIYRAFKIITNENYHK